jgi:hypothetical protein
MLNRTMTDHVPNDLSHLSDAEFNSLCPQGEHAPGPEPLSPAAQAVFHAFNSKFDWIEDGVPGPQFNAIAAALRAAADQIVPEAAACKNDWRWEIERTQRTVTRNQLLAIADELEAQP